MNHPLGLVLAAVTASTIPVTDMYDGMPPQRFQGNATVSVQFVANPNTAANCGVARKGYVFEGCSDGHTIMLPNPCPRGDTEYYARILCHELGHVNGWPGSHGP